jgi:hypothetical protein
LIGRRDTDILVKFRKESAYMALFSNIGIETRVPDPNLLNKDQNPDLDSRLRMPHFAKNAKIMLDFRPIFKIL